MTAKRFLNPGAWFFGGGDLHVETLLGSCVAISLWFPAAGKGGICHFLLPGKERVPAHARQLDGRYGWHAWVWLQQQVRAHGLQLGDAEIKVFGGSSTFQAIESGASQEVGEQNIAFAEALMEDAGLQVSARDLGGIGYRYLRFDLNTGDVWVRHGDALPLSPPGSKP